MYAKVERRMLQCAMRYAGDEKQNELRMQKIKTKASILVVVVRKRLREVNQRSEAVRSLSNVE
jgi:hypothetical protein